VAKSTSNGPQQSGRDELQAEWSDDAIVEPPNSTVDDWIGQRTDRDAERAEAALEQADGDEAAAERMFEEETERRDDEPSTDG
jgi:hypothetical protein